MFSSWFVCFPIGRGLLVGTKNVTSSIYINQCSCCFGITNFFLGFSSTSETSSCWAFTFCNVSYIPLVAVTPSRSGNMQAAMLNSTGMDNLFSPPVSPFGKDPVRKNKKINFHLNNRWHHNSRTKLRLPDVRKISNDFNDYYTTKKLKSDYWRINSLNVNSSNSIPVDFDVSGESLVIGNASDTQNLNFFKLASQDDTANSYPKVSLAKLQSVTVPGKPIVTTSLIDGCTAEQRLLTGHQDGKVNLISTTQNHSEIVKRFNHTKYLKSTSMWGPLKHADTPSPVRQLEVWQNDRQFVSVINDLLFIYSMEHTREPLYLNNHTSLQSVSLSKSYPYIMMLTLKDSVELLDVRTPQTVKLYSPNPADKLRCCEVMDTNRLAVGTSNAIDIVDWRNPQNDVISQCRGSGDARSLTHNSKLNELSCLDRFGNLSKWDMTYDAPIRTLKNGFRRTIDTDGFQCGDIVVSHGDIRQIKPWEGDSIATIGFEEVGVHRIVEVKNEINVSEDEHTYLNATSDTVSISSEDNTDVISWNTDVTTPCNSVLSLGEDNAFSKLYSLGEQ
ncbi:Dse1p KNAG_0D02190 [Huiozyma naganishii CBS 8797]|uniref:Uncharacterized protein n=1 Tax=Huiozyma naganishii (strain ATCC MYA-139 / BCRC 22969 / CBS 8797 / KCTC 17520 / NBRC 10181 / NCYC 3082 / Yp74L-3) TaxID=1071383 RepID=J7S5R8_HUIN7|nr:hypothetical protein KNAG_0D02190 [Kazachstania naganishii CBS 8797]CCK69969.1 hypothetical protein KNAG_0D02190 [Kazachstania naganishii CBS 8797]